VLLVEDDPDLREVLRMHVEALGHRVTDTGDAETALAALQEAQFDVIVVDLGLPRVDGYELARRTRALGTKTRIIALTGFTGDDDRRRAFAAGFDAFLIKPVEEAALRRALDA
jgi:CheY-like chemotaxis protein